MTTAEVEALFARTLAGDYESEDAWDAVRALRLNGSREIFEHAAAWCTSDDPVERARGADSPEIRESLLRCLSDRVTEAAAALLGMDRDLAKIGE